MKKYYPYWDTINGAREIPYVFMRGGGSHRVYKELRRKIDKHAKEFGNEQAFRYLYPAGMKSNSKSVFAVQWSLIPLAKEWGMTVDRDNQQQMQKLYNSFQRVNCTEPPIATTGFPTESSFYTPFNGFDVPLQPEIFRRMPWFKDDYYPLALSADVSGCYQYDANSMEDGYLFFGEGRPTPLLKYTRGNLYTNDLTRAVNFVLYRIYCQKVWLEYASN